MPESASAAAFETKCFPQELETVYDILWNIHTAQENLGNGWILLWLRHTLLKRDWNMAPDLDSKNNRRRQ